MEKPVQSVRIPTAALDAWGRVSFEVKVRLSDRLHRPMEEISSGDVLGEVIRIAAHHIFVDLYPDPAALEERQRSERARLQELIELEQRVNALEQMLKAPDSSEDS